MLHDEKITIRDAFDLVELCTLHRNHWEHYWEAACGLKISDDLLLEKVSREYAIEINAAHKRHHDLNHGPNCEYLISEGIEWNGTGYNKIIVRCESGV